MEFYGILLDEIVWNLIRWDLMEFYQMDSSGSAAGATEEEDLRRAEVTFECNLSLLSCTSWPQLSQYGANQGF